MPHGASPSAKVAARDLSAVPISTRPYFSRKIDALLHGAPLDSVASDNAAHLIAVLKERKRTAALAGKYATSQKCEDLVRYVFGMSQQRRFGVVYDT